MAAGMLAISNYTPARDRNGRLSSGARLDVYLNRTTTRATVYADAALTTPLENPVIANSSGQFPAVWAAEGDPGAPSLYSLAYSGSDGSSLGNPSTFDDIQPSVSLDLVSGLSKADVDGSNISDPSEFREAIGATSLEVVRGQNPELPLGYFLEGHEEDADHSPRINMAIDKLNYVTGQKGGTMRAGAFQYRIGTAIQPILTGATFIRGVGASRVTENTAPAVTLAKGMGTVFDVLSGTAPVLQWGNESGAGYLPGGGGISDVAFYYRDGANRLALDVMRTPFFLCDGVNWWRPHRAFRTYGGIGSNMMNCAIDQLTGGYAVQMIGDANNRADAFGMTDVFIGAQDASSGNQGDGIQMIGFAHSLQMNGKVQVVNPLRGLVAKSSLAVDLLTDHMKPHFIKADRFEVDFASEDCVRLENFRDCAFEEVYLHSRGTAPNISSLAHIISGQNRNNQVRFNSGKLSNGGGAAAIYTNCAGATYTGLEICPVSNVNGNGVFVDDLAEQTDVTNNKIGAIKPYATQSGMAGVRIAAGAQDTTVALNRGWGLATGIANAAPSGELNDSSNKWW